MNHFRELRKTATPGHVMALSFFCSRLTHLFPDVSLGHTYHIHAPQEPHRKKMQEDRKDQGKPYH